MDTIKFIQTFCITIFVNASLNFLLHLFPKYVFYNHLYDDLFHKQLSIFNFVNITTVSTVFVCIQNPMTCCHHCNYSKTISMKKKPDQHRCFILWTHIHFDVMNHMIIKIAMFEKKSRAILTCVSISAY